MAHNVLQFDYAEAYGAHFIEPIAIGELLLDDGTRSYDSVMLLLEDGDIVEINCTSNTDELVVRKINMSKLRRSDRVGVPLLDDYRGLALGWCWVGMNWRGYKDMFTLAFGGMDPDVAFVAAASKVHCYRLAA